MQRIFPFFITFFRACLFLLTDWRHFHAIRSGNLFEKIVYYKLRSSLAKINRSRMQFLCFFLFFTVNCWSICYLLLCDFKFSSLQNRGMLFPRLNNTYFLSCRSNTSFLSCSYKQNAFLHNITSISYIYSSFLETTHTDA